MTIDLYLRYHTQFGESFYVSGNNQYLGDNDASNAVQMSWLNNDFWHLSFQLPDDFDDLIRYRYILKDKNGAEIFDGEESRFIDFSKKKLKALTVIDTWNSAGNIGNVYFTRAFTKILLPPLTKTKIVFPKKYTHEFRVKAPLLQPGETVCLCGSTQNLKNWNCTGSYYFNT